MIDERGLLDRAARVIAPPERVMDGLVRRRDRKRRNQRIGTVLVALLLGIAAVGTAVRAFQSSPRHLPAERPITPDNVAHLERSWTAGGFGSDAPVVSGGTVFVGASGTNGRVLAYDASCNGPTCDPMWTGNTGRGVARITVADGTVFAVNEYRSGTSAQGHLFAFPTGCGTDGATCAPLWTANTGVVHDPEMAPIVDGDTVLVANTGGRLLAYSISRCRTGGAVCRPSWTASLGGHAAVAIAASGGTVYVATDDDLVRAFSTTCPSSRCGPEWTRSVPSSVVGLATDGSVLYVGMLHQPSVSATSLIAIPTDCPGGACDPLWKAKTGCCIQPWADGDVVYARDQLSGVFAYPARCRTDGGVCEPAWTADLGRIFGSAPIVATKGLVFVGTTGGGVYALPATCSSPCDPLWYGTAGVKGAGVGVSGDHVFAVSRGLVAFSLGSGERTRGAQPGSAELVFYAVVALIALGVLLASVRRRRSV